MNKFDPKHEIFEKERNTLMHLLLQKLNYILERNSSALVLSAAEQQENKHFDKLNAACNVEYYSIIEFQYLPGSTDCTFKPKTKLRLRLTISSITCSGFLWPNKVNCSTHMAEQITIQSIFT